MENPRSRAVMTSVPEDIVIHILLRLPVKSLQRLKYASKSWYSLISDPYFIKLHLQFSNNHPKLIVPISYLNNTPYLYDLISRKSTQIALPLKNIKQYHGPAILCSCDGLILLACHYGAREQILVWNPLTRENRELPKLDTHRILLITRYNLGYDSSTDDYNVIRETYVFSGDFGFSYRRVLMVFSLKKSTSWRRIKKFKYNISLRKCINLNGALHWLPPPRPDKDKILCFSLGEETIMEMELPHNDVEIVLRRKLSILRGCLCLSETITLYPHHPSVSLNIWLMKEFGSWNKFVTIPQLLLSDPLRGISAPYYSMNKAIFIIKKGSSSTLVIYDLEKKKFDIIGCKKDQYLRKGFAFVESLVSPNF